MYKNLIISSESQEDASLNSRSHPKGTAVSQHPSAPSHSQRNQCFRRVGIQPKDRLDSYSFEGSLFNPSSISENDSEEDQRDDENDGAQKRQRAKDTHERRLKSPKDSHVHQKRNKLENFILKSGILQQDESLSTKNSSFKASLSESNLNLQPSDEMHISDPLQTKSPTKTEPLKKDAFDSEQREERSTFSRKGRVDSKLYPNQYQESEHDYDDLIIEEQPSVDSLCSITEKWNRLMNGEGYTPPPGKGPSCLEQRPSDEVLGLIGPVADDSDDTSFPFNEDSERSFKPLLLLAEKTIVDSQPETNITSTDSRKFDTMKSREPSHAVSEQKSSAEATVGAKDPGALAAFYQFIDKFFVRSEAVNSTGNYSSNPTESQMNRARLNRSKAKKKTRKGRKSVRFEDEAPFLSSETLTCERLRFMLC